MSWLGLLLTVGGFAAYLAAVSRFAFFAPVPWAFLAVMTLGVVLSVVGFGRRPGVLPGIGAALTLAAFAGASWYLFAYSIFDAREVRPAVGDRFPDFGPLPTSTGGTFRLADARGEHLVLLFYRGAW